MLIESAIDPKKEKELAQQILGCWNDGSKIRIFPQGVVPSSIKLTTGMGIPILSRDIKMLPSDHKVEVSGDGGVEDTDA